jgi:hypothetical protein
MPRQVPSGAFGNPHQKRDPCAELRVGRSWGRRIGAGEARREERAAGHQAPAARFGRSRSRT